MMRTMSTATLSGCIGNFGGMHLAGSRQSRKTGAYSCQAIFYIKLKNYSPITWALAGYCIISCRIICSQVRQWTLVVACPCGVRDGDPEPSSISILRQNTHQFVPDKYWLAKTTTNYQGTMPGRLNHEQNIGFNAQEEAVQPPQPLLHLSPEFLSQRLQYCSKCRWIFENADLSIQDYLGKEYDFHHWAGLTNAAREGCHHCYVLLNTLDEEHVLRFTNPDSLGSEESTSPLKLRIRSWDRSWTGTPGVMVSWELHSVKQQLYDITLEPLAEGIDLSKNVARILHKFSPFPCNLVANSHLLLFFFPTR